MNEIKEGWSKEDLMQIAKWQKSIIFMLLVTFVATFIPFATIITGIILISFIYNLAKAIRSSAAWLYIILAFVPLISPLALLHINSRATKILQANEIKVRLMGVRMKDFERQE